MLPNNVANNVVNDVSFSTPCCPHISIENAIESLKSCMQMKKMTIAQKQLAIPHSTTPSLMSQNVYQGVIYHYSSTFTILATNCRIII
jgi:pectin methylesterase-like acyl-CoA thioesterase